MQRNGNVIHGCHQQRGGAGACCVAAIAETAISCDTAPPPCLMHSDATMASAAAAEKKGGNAKSKRARRPMWSSRRLAERRATYGDVDDDAGVISGINIDCVGDGEGVLVRSATPL
jgi:hypothetical protein